MPYPETIKYIKKQLKEDDSPERVDRIKKALSDSGYQQDVIDELMEKAGVQKPEEKTSGIEQTLFKDIAIGLIVCIVVASLVYTIFFNDFGKEFFSPKDNINLDFKRLSPIEIKEDGSYAIDLGKYVKDSNYEDSEIRWSYSGKLCIGIEVSGTEAILTSVFLPGCPSEEYIEFSAMNPSNEISSDTLHVKII